MRSPCTAANTPTWDPSTTDQKTFPLSHELTVERVVCGVNVAWRRSTNMFDTFRNCIHCMGPLHRWTFTVVAAHSQPQQPPSLTVSCVRSTLSSTVAEIAGVLFDRRGWANNALSPSPSSLCESSMPGRGRCESLVWCSEIFLLIYCDKKYGMADGQHTFALLADWESEIWGTLFSLNISKFFDFEVLLVECPAGVFALARVTLLVLYAKY